MIKTQLIDNSNVDQFLPIIAPLIKSAAFTGIDVETQDDNRHDGLNLYCGYDPETRTKSSGKPLVFDMRRTVMTGFSLYPENHDTAYYINLNQADIQQRIPFHKVAPLLDNPNHWIAHNANYELTAFKSTYNVDLSANMVCTLQLAVTAFGPDEYDIAKFHQAGLGEMEKFKIPLIIASATGYDPKSQEMSPELSEMVYKIIAKESNAAHSYNGFIKGIAYGYGLKPLVKQFFQHDMTTFEQVLGGKAHMGLLTGPQVASYGAEDSYWAVRLFRYLMSYVARECPKAFDTFFTQENPMVPVYSSIWMGGMKVNYDAIKQRRQEERDETAALLRKMKATVKKLLPFPAAPHEKLYKDEKWYKNKDAYKKYRKSIVDWASMPDSDDSYTQVSQVRGAVPNAWRAERGDRESTGPNFSHYMPIRTLIYDLLSEKAIMGEGKVQSDGNARGKLKDRVGEGDKANLISFINQLSGIEQRMKLYLTPYTMLTDPETERLYPVVSSQLATRRMAASFPNPMQLAKRGDSTYVRGFFQGDYEDHVVVSLDLSGIELVIIGELSQDPEFIKAFGQLPHGDLHSGAAADILSVDAPGLNESSFKFLKQVSSWEDFTTKYGSSIPNIERLKTNLKGEFLDAANSYKYWRTEVGKGANFNYWYSGFLATVGERLGWSMDKTQLATERYKSRFSVAEDWRLNTIAMGQRDGFVTLPDNLRRVRYEATNEWNVAFQDKWMVRGQDNLESYHSLINWITKKIQRRAHNQLVNAMVQGTCSTLIKRSVIAILKEAKARGWDDRICRFMMPIHDEVLFSVQRKYVAEFIKMAKQKMMDHPDLFKSCILDSTPAVGITFEPWSPKNPLGQVELAEAPKFDWLDPSRYGKALNDNEIGQVVDYLFEMKGAA